MAVGERSDPYLGFHFRLEIEGLVVAGFSEVSGLQVEVETEDYQEGGNNDFVHKLRKGTRYPNLILKRGVVDADALWKWHQKIAKHTSKTDRKTVRVTLLDSEGKDKLSWRCLKAYPIKWTGPDLKGDGTNVALESLELVHSGIERA
jgi:phage tail-like protein